MLAEQPCHATTLIASTKSLASCTSVVRSAPIVHGNNAKQAWSERMKPSTAVGSTQSTATPPYAPPPFPLPRTPSQGGTMTTTTRANPPDVTDRTLKLQPPAITSTSKIKPGNAVVRKTRRDAKQNQTKEINNRPNRFLFHEFRTCLLPPRACLLYDYAKLLLWRNNYLTLGRNRRGRDAKNETRRDALR